MNDEQFEREKLYQATMSMFKGMLREGVIDAPRRGEVAFAVPYLREYLLEHYEQMR